MITNALKYGRGRPVEVLVETVASQRRVAVRDQGVDIAPDDQQRIFDRFERASSTRSFGGIGLGLWIVREMVHSLHGEVRVESELAPARPSSSSCRTIYTP